MAEGTFWNNQLHGFKAHDDRKIRQKGILRGPLLHPPALLNCIFYLVDSFSRAFGTLIDSSAHLLSSASCQCSKRFPCVWGRDWAVLDSDLTLVGLCWIPFSSQRVNYPLSLLFQQVLYLWFLCLGVGITHHAFWEHHRAFLAFVILHPQVSSLPYSLFALWFVLGSSCKL